MSWMLTGYSNFGCQEFIMPEKDNANHTIVLDHSIFGTTEDTEIRFEIVSNVWRFVGASSNCALSNHSIRPGKLIDTGDVIHLSAGTESIAVIAMEFSADISGMKKYSTKNSSLISIGTEADNDIVISNIPLISRHHVSLAVNGGICTIIDKSKNGTFVNGKRIKSQTNAKYGDCISLFGIQIVWLGGVIAVGNKCGQIRCNLPQASIPGSTIAKKLEKPQVEGKHYFRRSPRNLPKFYTEKIEIEAPPQPQKIGRRPLLLTIGPSLTMTLPMIVGTGIAIWGSQASGASTNLYMYTGIIIAVMSAIVGTIWALVNLNYSKKKEIEGSSFVSQSIRITFLVLNERFQKNIHITVRI